MGIDVPIEKPPQGNDANNNNDNDTTNTTTTTAVAMTIPASTSSTSISGASMLTASSQPTKSTSLHSLNSQSSSSPRGSMTRLSNQTSVEHVQEPPSRGSMRARAATVATNSLPSRGNRGRSPGPSNYQRSASPLLNVVGLARADGKYTMCNVTMRKK